MSRPNTPNATKPSADIPDIISMRLRYGRLGISFSNPSFYQNSGKIVVKYTDLLLLQPRTSPWDNQHLPNRLCGGALSMYFILICNMLASDKFRVAIAQQNQASLNYGKIMVNYGNRQNQTYGLSGSSQRVLHLDTDQYNTIVMYKSRIHHKSTHSTLLPSH